MSMNEGVYASLLSLSLKWCGGLVGGLGEEMEGNLNRNAPRRKFEERKGSKVGMDHALGEESHEQM